MFSPAKINIGLQVHHKREHDGYHYISSIFVPIGFTDELHVRVGKDAHALLSTVNLSKPMADLYAQVSERGDFRRNLLYIILEKASAYIGGDVFSLELVKNIPLGGGLGGGSSNAGTLLSYLGEKYSIPDENLSQIALSAGADVPFFLQENPCFVSGVGEVLEPIAVGKGHGVLCVSGIMVDTHKAYQKLKRALQATPCPKTLRGLDSKALVALEDSKWSSLRGLSNDFEQPVFEDYPELSQVKDRFYIEGAELSMMTGSGSTVYALVDTLEASVELEAKMKLFFPAFHFESFDF